MRERDLNRTFNQEGDIDRIRAILFPKKHAITTTSTIYHQKTTSIIEKDDGDEEKG